METHPILEPNSFYHIYNRAVGDDKLFKKSGDYDFFMHRWSTYIAPYVDVWAYCLIPNHFHFAIRVLSERELRKRTYVPQDQYNVFVSNQFRKCFGSYAKKFNNAYSRKGKLFMVPFKRKLVSDTTYLAKLIVYIHQNPIHHGISSDAKGYKYSSLSELLSNESTWLCKIEVFKLFGGKEHFVTQHEYLLKLSKAEV